MGNYVSTSTTEDKEEENLSLEKACKLLENNETEDVVYQKTTLDNMVSTRTGVITDVVKDNYIIDDKYVANQSGGSFPIGSTVSYNLFCSDNTYKAVNLVLVNNEWDVVEDSNSLWNNRIIMCQVEKRVERKLFLSDTDIVLDLDNVSLEFLPIVGDWLELDVKCSVDESNLDLSGKIIEINKISPVRLHLEIGKITSWKTNEQIGTINNKIFFNKSSLSMGYVPFLGDKIIAEVIESDQNRCSWRAIKVLPENESTKLNKLSKSPINISDCQTDHPDLKINDIHINFNKLGERKNFIIDIENISENSYTINKIEFIDSLSQCKINNSTENIEILPKNISKIECQCLSGKAGDTKEFIILHFDNFILGKWIHISVTINSSKQSIPYELKPKYELHKPSQNELIRGQRLNGTRFTTIQVPNYMVPQKLVDVVSKYNNDNKIEYLIQQIQLVKPSLTSNLTLINYEDKFHTLLHLDEIANLMAIRMYDQDRVCFIRNGEYLMLEIENLSEKRPSLVIGDKIIATDPMNKKGLDYEGFIHRVGAKHIYIKFNHLFHDTYNNEDYSIKVVPGRAAYRRLHHAVHLAVRNLGADVLFPTKIIEKDPQVTFKWDEDTPLSNRKLILRKIREQNSNELKLEWYNKTLDCTQKNAVKHILWGKARPLPYIIFGPPGTGKTVTIIEAILQIIRLLPCSRVLVTAPSNSAADLIAIRLINSGVLLPGDLVRVVSYNYALSDMIPVELVPYCSTVSIAKEDTTLGDISSKGIRFECKQSTLGRHRITVATCSAAGQFFNLNFPKGHFTHIIVDEAAQAGEPDVMIPMSFLDKNSGQVILAGDPLQLGPVIICKVASECGLSESYLERITNRFPYVKDPEGFPDTSGLDPRLVTKLLYNYRALPDILNLYNQLFYDNELICTIDSHTSKEANFLNTLQEILPHKNDGGLSQIVFHGVDGENFQTADSPSWFNPHEAAQVFYYVNELYRLGVKCENIGIITPYIKQVKEIRSLLHEAEFEVPRVGTIEEFQGQEFDVIILSTVRSREEYLSSDILHSLGFVASPKRLNVAISRAKSLLVVIGNPKLLCHDTYWRNVVNYCIDKGSYVGCEF